MWWSMPVIVAFGMQRQETIKPQLFENHLGSMMRPSSLEDVTQHNKAGKKQSVVFTSQFVLYCRFLKDLLRSN